MRNRVFLLVVVSFVWSLDDACQAQHDGARDAVRHIADGKFNLVDGTLKTKKPFAGEAESAFVQMLSMLAQDRVDAAFALSRKAVDAGLPFERLVAGPREQLSKLHALPEFQAWKQQVGSSSLVHGPMVGSVTDDASCFWVRTDQAARVRVVLDNGLSSPPKQTTAAEDFTAVLQVTGLDPETSYSYFVEIDGQQMESSAFQTFPEVGKSGEFSVGFGGGAGYVPEWESMWDTILDAKPDAFLMLGDNVYIDQPRASLTNHYCYYRRQSRPEWKRFTAQTPIFSIWDDHDFGTNDCVPGPEIERPAWKRSVWNIFRQNWANPGYGGGHSQPGCWYDFHLGDVHFIMLDGRYYRDLKGGTMLGPVQKQWLFEKLAGSTATFKVIASPVPFTPEIKPGSRDPWDGFPEEREEIFNYIADNQVEGVLLVAADRHRTDLRKIRRNGAYDLYEFESSRLTNHHTHPVVRTAGLIWGYNQTCSFALMKFDTTARDPQVTLECVSIAGDSIASSIVRRSVLEFADLTR